MNKRIKVLYIIPRFVTGGAERRVLNLMQHIDKDIFETVALSFYPKCELVYEKEIKEKGFKVFFLNMRSRLDVKVVLGIHRVLKEYRPDIVHTSLYALFYSIAPIVLNKVPVRVHTISNIAKGDAPHPLVKISNWLSFRFFGVVPVSISKSVAQSVKEFYGSNIQTPIIYNGVSIERFIEYSKKPKTITKNLVLICIARLAPEKNHKVLIESFHMALKEYADMELWLVGDGPLRSEIEKLVKEKGLESKVIFWGERSDIPWLLSQSDIFVLSSDYEGVSNAILEAMATAKPIVATAVGGTPEVVECSKTGVLVPPSDPKALSQAILKLAKDPELRKRMGEEGQRRAIEHFDIKQMVRQYEELYLSLLKKAEKSNL